MLEHETRTQPLTSLEEKRLASARAWAVKLSRGNKTKVAPGPWLQLPESERKAAASRMSPAYSAPDQVWINNRVLVLIHRFRTGGAEMACVMVRPHDGKPIAKHWRELQQIKEEVVGDVLAVEVYPPANVLVDVWQIYHLWCFLEPTELPFGLHLPGLHRKDEA